MDQTKNSTLNSNFNKHIFRDYDIRGIPNKDFQPEFANQLATAIHKFFPEGKIVLSRDLRKSGIFLLENMQNTFSSLGREVINIGENPTPILYYATCKEQATGSIQITASHKGKEWNGFKINGTQANPIDAETGIYKIKDLIIKGCSIEGVEGANLPKHHIFERASKSDLSEAKLRSSNCGPAPNERSETFNTAKEITGTVETKNYQQQYINEITNNISINQNKKLNVVIDTGNGSVGNILRTILENKNIKVIAINEQINDEFFMNFSCN